MQRLHIHIGVANLDQSIQFYNSLFATEPVKTKSDYAKWMLDDPCINFAISTRSGNQGVDHLGLQVDDSDELETLRERVKNADLAVYDEGETVCCYARTDKSWLKDPSGVAWEAFQTMDDAQVFGSHDQQDAEVCCTPESKDQSECCVPA